MKKSSEKMGLVERIVEMEKVIRELSEERKEWEKHKESYAKNIAKL